MGIRVNTRQYAMYSPPDYRRRGMGDVFRRYINGENTARIIWVDDQLVCQMGTRKKQLWDEEECEEEEEEESEEEEEDPAPPPPQRNTAPPPPPKANKGGKAKDPAAAAPAAASSSAEEPNGRPKRVTKALRRA